MSNNVSPTENKQMSSDVKQLQSSTIDLLRFPLAIMVVFAHMNPETFCLLDAKCDLLSSEGFYNVVAILCSHVIPHISVPTFFFISGLLFFLNFQEWSWNGYLKKLESRKKTLVIPYVTWNLSSFVLLLLFLLAGVLLQGEPISELYSVIQENSWHIFYDCNEWGKSIVNWLGKNVAQTGPYDLPLWFLRDLIVVTLLTPLIYFGIKKLKIFLIIILFIAYISRIWISLPGLQINAVFYFSLGAYFALNNINIVLFTSKYRFFIMPLFIALLIAATIYNGLNTIIGMNIFPFVIFTGVFAVFYIASQCIVKFNIRPNKFLVSCCFFIYAFHGVRIPVIGSPLPFTKVILNAVIPGDSNLERIVTYLITPFLATLICIAIFQISKRLFPKATLLFSGNK